MKETELSIKFFPDPVLKKKARAVLEVSQRNREILSKMAQLMYDHSGIGLAAPQVGISECMIVADIGSGLYKLVNPRLVSKEGTQTLEEGCLSVPEVCIKIRRAKRIVVSALDDTGKRVKIEADGLLACVLQHEMDHLRGKVIVDYANFLDKVRIKKRLLELKKKYKNEGLSESETKSCKLQL
ncbi:MAG: peptide deformylase [Candidatus Omnitrophica bacterium]|nr:peptide deformylase [Candidatus Omnitrophota bacterium]